MIVNGPQVETQQIGLIGIGKMGLPMARRLLARGYRVNALDVSPERSAAAVEAGATVFESPACVARTSDVLILSLPDAGALRQVMSDAGGVLDADLAGKVVVDTTTATRMVAIEMATEVCSRGGRMLDAPVTGGVGGATAGTLTFFVGGDPDALDRVRPLLGDLGAHVGYMGASGSGQVAKMAKQMLGSVKFCIAAEVLGFAHCAGLDIPSLVDALGESSLLTQMLKVAETREYGSEGYLGQRGKDLDYAFAEARRLGCYTPITDAMHEMFVNARAKGYGHMDPIALSLLYREDGE